MQNTQDVQVQSLGQEGPLEKEAATHSSILAWEIPWMEEPGGLQSMGSQRVRHNLVTKQQQFMCSFVLAESVWPSQGDPMSGLPRTVPVPNLVLTHSFIYQL